MDGDNGNVATSVAFDSMGNIAISGYYDSSTFQIYNRNGSLAN